MDIKMVNEFVLSEKINGYGYNDDGTPDEDVLSIEDVKEFIKKDTKLIKDFINEKINNVELFEKRMELAGKDLI